MENIGRKVENLRGGIQELAHEGELDISAFMALGPVLGITRAENQGTVVFDDHAYMAHIHKQLTEPEGIQKLEKHYGSLTEEGRREIGRAINKLRSR